MKKKNHCRSSLPEWMKDLDSGYGDGSGYGYGDGSGYGSGYGSGDGSVDGSGYGDGEEYSGKIMVMK